MGQSPSLEFVLETPFVRLKSKRREMPGRAGKRASNGILLRLFGLTIISGLDQLPTALSEDLGPRSV